MTAKVEKRQSPQEMMLEIMRFSGLRREGGGHVTTVEQIQNALGRVGLRGADRLQWALKFANSDPSKFTPGDWLNVQLELGAFRLPIFAKLPAHKAQESIPVPDAGSAFFPSLDEVRQIHERFRRLLESYANTKEISFTYKGETDVTLRGGIFYASARGQGDSCAVQFTKLIAEFSDRVRVCPIKDEEGKDRHGCGNWFFAARADRIYCSSTCLNRHTTKVLRAKLDRQKKGRAS